MRGEELDVNIKMPTSTAELAARLQARLATVERSRERGDVAAWVLIVVMTAGIVVALWAFAGKALQDMLEKALKSVT
jgi:hypothetical protein